MAKLLQASTIFPADTLSISSIRAVDGLPNIDVKPPDSLACVSIFGNFIDGVDAPQTMANTLYNGSKILLDVIDKVGCAVPPLRAAAGGIRRIMTVVDVCTSWLLATTMLELTTPLRVRT